MPKSFCVFIQFCVYCLTYFVVLSHLIIKPLTIHTDLMKMFNCVFTV